MNNLFHNYPNKFFLILLISLYCSCTREDMVVIKDYSLRSLVDIQEEHVNTICMDILTIHGELTLRHREDIINNINVLKECVQNNTSIYSEELLLDKVFSTLSLFRNLCINIQDFLNSLNHGEDSKEHYYIAARIASICAKANEYLETQETLLKSIDVRLTTMEKYLTLLTSSNLFPDGALEQNKNGIAVIPAGIGKFIFEGRPSTWTSYNLCRYTNTLPNGLYPGKEYYISFRETPGGSTYYVQYYEKGNSSPITILTLSETYRSGKFVLPENAIGFRVWVHMSPTYCVCHNTELQVVLVSSNSSFYSNLLIEDNHPIPKNPLPILTIIDDDGFKKFKKLLLPIIQDKQIPIASSIPTSHVGTIDKVMTWDEIAECAYYGAEILSHTHSNLSREKANGMSINEIAYDYRRSQYILRNHGFKSETLVFVGDSSNDPNCIEACKQVFKYGIKAGTNKTNYYGSTNKYQINRWSINPGDSLEHLKRKIDELLDSKTGWMIWMIHTSSGDFQQPFANVLSEVIEYALDKGIVIGTTEYAISQYCVD